LNYIYLIYNNAYSGENVVVVSPDSEVLSVLYAGKSTTVYRYFDYKYN